jgi:hypothetical protein
MPRLLRNRGHSKPGNECKDLLLIHSTDLRKGK